MDILETLKAHIIADTSSQPVSFDLGPLQMDGAALKAVVDQLYANVKPHNPQLLVTLENHSLCMAALADRLGVSSFTIPGPRSGNKLEVDRSLFDTLKRKLKSAANLRAVIIDDIIATGVAAEALSKALQAARVSVDHVACLIEVPEGGRQKINQLGISVSSLVDYNLSGEFRPGITTPGEKISRRPKRVKRLEAPDSGPPGTK